MTENAHAMAEQGRLLPTVGRVVHYSPLSYEGEGPWAAVVARVWNEFSVNLCVFDGNGIAIGRAPVVYDEEGKPGTWRWPPRT